MSRDLSHLVLRCSLKLDPRNSLPIVLVVVWNHKFGTNRNVVGGTVVMIMMMVGNLYQTFSSENGRGERIMLVPYQ